MTAVSKNVYIDKLDDIVNGYNNTYHRTIKMKPADVNNNTHIDFKKKVNDKDPKFKVGDHVRISKYKNIFAKGYMPNWSKEVFVTKKGKNKKKLLEHFMKKNCRRLINKDLELKKCFKKKEINYMFNGYGRVMVVYLIVGLIKKI